MAVGLRRRSRLNVAEFVELTRPLPDEERWELLDGKAVLTAVQSALPDLNGEIMLCEI